MNTQPDIVDVDVELPYDALVSYYYFQSEQVMTEITDHGRLRLIADSGAFSAYTQGARIDIDAYAAWISHCDTHNNDEAAAMANLLGVEYTEE